LPEGWCAVAALHDTLSDRITICDSGQLPLVRADDIRRLEAAFAAAGAQVRQERAPDLGFSTMADLSAFLTRGNDWAQVRP
ncbi:putative inorganic carbon transporter subunit DabA, partial [Acinetobacter baumannii]